MKRSFSQSEREFRSGIRHVGNLAGATNLTAQRCSQSNNLQRTSSLTSLRSGERYRDRFWVPSEGNLPLSKGPRAPSSTRVAKEASLDISHDSGVWVRDSSVVGETSVKLDQYPTKENGEGMFYGSQPQISPIRGSMNSLKGHNPQDSVLSLFPDDDSGFNSTLRSRSRSGMYISDDYNQSSPRMNRSRSMSRLHLNHSQDLDPSLLSLRQRPFEHSLRNLKDNLEDSENRRVVLVHKLKEAQETLELQNDRLNRIEGTAKTNSVLVDDLKYKEHEYRSKIELLERSEDEKSLLRNENLRLREEMQDRIDKLDSQLRSLQAQHQVSETENMKRSNLLAQTTQALSLLENENNRLKKDKDTLRQEILVAKEAMELAREKFGPMEDENKSLKTEVDRHKEKFEILVEENEKLLKKSQQVTGQMNELRNLTESMKEENEKLAHSWKTLAEEKQKLAREIDNNQESYRDTKARVSNLSSERDRLFHEKMELSGKIQQLMIDKEQVEKTKIALEEQIAEQEEEMNRVKKLVKRKDGDRIKLEETLQESKNNYDEIYKELANVRAYYERSLEQISVLENGKQLAVQQLELSEHEKNRLHADNERLRDLLDGRSRDLKNEREQLEEAVMDLKSEIRQIRQEKSKADDKVQELEIKLEKANEDVKETTSMKQGEIDMLKATCDRLSAGSTKKETEIQELNDHLQKSNLQNERLKEELRTFKDECEQLQDQVEDIKKLKEENRRMLQEKAENEQVIKLLETQKEVLSKSAETSMDKLKDIDKLTEKIDQYRSDNEHLRNRIGELEKVRDNLIAQKEELLANSELIYKKPQLEELEAKIEELREANRQLREINEQVNEKAEVLGQENATLKDAIGGDGAVVPRVELERLSREKERLQSDMDRLQKEHENLEERHQRFIIQYGHDGTETQKDRTEIQGLKREKEALEKQVALINGQMLLVEGGKKRLDDVVDDLQTEIVSLRQQLEEAEKKLAEYTANKESENKKRHQPEVEALQEEINILNEQLDESKYEQDKQRRLIQTLKDESLDDVGSELHEMRNELHKLMGVIESKDHAIETLENQLRTSKDQIKVKDDKMTELQSLVTELQEKNEDLHKSVDGVRLSVEEKLISPRVPSPSPTRKIEDGKESSEQIKRSQSEKGGDRLQSLISKYRGYSDAGSSVPERKIKPLSLSPSNKMGLVTKGRSFGPAAAKGEKEVQ